jgi:aspartyl-tRNA(Asn)/glutamyl-tRNA(Gln) amidotransferase subunit B
MTGIDLNRAGTPLLEIVSEPDMRSSDEAVAYAKTLHALVRWIGICDGNMQEGSFRCDANVSVRPLGATQLGTRCEIKNLNSFRFLQQAIEFEVRRQIELIEDGGTVVQETRLYDPDRDETRSMRSKEDAQDYRYFPDPDLLPFEIPASRIEAIRRSMPALPQELRTRYEKEHALSPYQSALLTESREKARFFEASLGHVKSVHLAANWVTGEMSALLNDRNADFSQAPIAADAFGGLLARIEDGTISAKAAKEVLRAMADGEGDADAVIAKRGLKQISDAGALEAAVDQVLAAQPKLVADYRAGKEKAFNALVGQAMKATRGKANPQQVNEILRRRLSGN